MVLYTGLLTHLIHIFDQDLTAETC